jgi:NADPH:quinone reductase-like Zn-dependent oxidoreductase
MRAIALDDYGAPPALRELPVPQPGPGEVLVRVEASSVNGFDGGVVGGYLKGMMEHRFPVVPGKDFAGAVAGVGSGVSRFKAGDRVFGVVITPALGPGAWGEYVAVPEGFVASVPAGLDLQTAGTIGLAGAAALAAVDSVAPSSGETVLISGATGGVGAIAIQLAKARGATVVATARPGDEESFVRGLGADATVDFTNDLTAAVRALHSAGVPVALHFAGDPATVADLVASGGRLASTLGFTQEAAGDRSLTVATIMANPDTATLERLAAEVGAGRLRVPVQRTYALSEVPQALADFGRGTLGKLAVRVQ